MAAPSPWHAHDVATIARNYAVDPSNGLSDEEAAARLARHGPNRPTLRPGRSALARFATQMVEPLVLVLIASGLVTAALGEWVDSGVIFGVVLVNALVGFIQEGKAEAALAALARAVAAETTVLRESRRMRRDAAELVPGDVVLLAAGDKVPADLRLVASKDLRTQEAALTGESLPVDKHWDALPADTPLAERRNMAYAGTVVVAGQGRGVVVATGDGTETGRIAELIAQAPDLSTPLTRQMAGFSRQLLWIILALAALTFVVGVLRGETAVEMFMAAVALAVGAIPEGLPAAVTVTLAIGVARMAKRRAIVRKLPAVETLGSTTVICSDKTGTLTENEMTVLQLWCGGERFALSGHGYSPSGHLAAPQGERASGTAALRETLLAGVLCNDAGLRHADGRWTIHGDPTEAALLVAARKGGLDEIALQALFPRRDELPFDSARQLMATLHSVEGRDMVYVKGAPEKVLAACEAMLAADGRHLPLARAGIEDEARAMARQGLRVLALARREAAQDAPLATSHLESGLCLLGLAGMLDPPRAHAVAAVKACQRAGIRVKMITGDHAETALAIARRLGIADDAGCALSGRGLAALSDDALAAVTVDVDVFARVEPEQKLRLVRALQAGGAVVAMTGDGVNDAPALKQADIGIAMGLGGTDVAKEAAAMVLTDDNFATIEAAVEEGRGIYANLVKFVTWTLPTNFGEGLVILAAILLGMTLPITPLQILWINMTTAVLLGMPLAFEPVEQDVMAHPPRRPGSRMLDAALVRRILLVSTLMLLGAFGLFMLYLERGAPLAEARTVACNVFVLVEAAYLFCCRSLTRPLWRVAPFGNGWVWAGAGSMLALQLAFTYLPAMNRTFQTAPIGWAAWLEILLVAALATVAVEIGKWRRIPAQPAAAR